jgi:hypothetical protein
LSPSCARRSWIETAFGTDLAAAEATRRKAAQLRSDLAGPEATPLERLLADRAIACWLQVSYVDTLLAQRLRGGALPWEATDHYQRWLDRAQKRYLAALKTLAQVRRLLAPLPTLMQVNIADKQQVNNVAGAGAGLRPATAHAADVSADQGILAEGTPDARPRPTQLPALADLSSAADVLGAMPMASAARHRRAAVARRSR